MLGRRFGEFVIKGHVGAGGAGQVYLAEQVTLARDVVVKVLNQSQTGDPAAAERFMREARLASTLDHPFAAHVYGFGLEPDGTLWIAMELVRGTPLEQLVREHGPIPLARLVPFFERLCEVVHAAHEQGIVHRDIKPANVMVLTRSGRLLPKLLDLGIARRQAAKGAEPAPGAELGELAEAFPSTAQHAAVGTGLSATAALLRAETVELTHLGAVVGTPLYMAPEQWLDASKAEPRTDVYSLALLAHFALVGRPPFEGRSLRALAKAHGTAPLPPLPAELPATLHAALARGAAKRPADRYTTALELAAAVRTGAQLLAEPRALPQLADAERDNALNDAPQPIAEALALIEAARSAHQQLEAVDLVSRTIARYLGVLALCSRAKVGVAASADGPAARALLERLVEAGLTTLEWVQLARELCRPFATRPLAHPLPDLVTFFFTVSPEGAVTPSRGDEAWGALERLLAAAPPASADDAQYAALAERMAVLGTLLKRLSFIYDYALTVQAERPERYMGTRRGTRAVQKVAQPLPEPHVAWLVDPEGQPVLSLAPLVQLFSPGAGLPEELFWFESKSRHGARMVALPLPFERHSDAVEEWLHRTLPQTVGRGAALERPERAPYKGLSAFTSDDADNYFGREVEAETFANRLRLSGLLAVVGPSGAGKSSFVLAGVLPLLPRGWKAVVTRPGATPFAALEAKLKAAGYDLRGARGEGLAEALGGRLAEPESVLLVVDQFEELVTLCPDEGEREAFAATLLAVAYHPSGRLKVVVTLRDDFLIRIQQLAAFRQTLSSSLQLLGTPARAELLKVIVEPARRVGYGFDDDALPGRMVDEVAGHPGALALLSFTASQLWELRDRQLMQLRAKTYQALGGVGGALAHHAESTLAGLDAAEQGLLREALRHLVTSQGTRAVMSRREMLEVLGGGAPAHKVLEKLVSARLLVTSEDASGEDRVELIHEALLVSWPRLVAWQREDAETARLRDALRSSARQWEERGRPKGLLWRAETLAEYRFWRTRFRGRLTQVEAAFTEASLADERRARRLRNGALGAVFVGLVVGIALVTGAYRQAHASALAMRQEQGRLALLDERPLDALTYLAQAARDGADNPALRRMAGLIDFKLQGLEAELGRESSGALALARAGDGAKVAVVWRAGTASLVDAASGERRGLPLEHVMSVASSPGRLVFGTADGVVTLVRPRDGAIERQVQLERRALRSVAVSADGRWVSAAGPGPDSVLVDARSGEHRAAGSLEGALISTTAISPTGRWVATFSGNYQASAESPHGLALFDTQRDVQLMLATEEAVGAVLFHPTDADRLWVSTDQGQVGLLSVQKRDWVWKQKVGSAPVKQLALSPDARWVAFGADKTVGLLSAESGASALSDLMPSTAMSSCFSPSGSTVVFGGLQGELRVYDTSPPALRWVHFGHVDRANGCLALDEQRLVSSSFDGSLKRWSLSTRVQGQLTGPLKALALTVDRGDGSAYFALADGVWHVAAGGEPQRLVARALGQGVLLSASGTGELAVLDGHTVERYRVDAGGAVRLGAFANSTTLGDAVLAPGGEQLALADLDDGSIRVVSAQSGEAVSTLAARERLNPGLFRPAHRFIACSESGVLRAFDLSGPRAEEVGAGRRLHNRDCWPVWQGDQVATYSLDGTVRSNVEGPSPEVTVLPGAIAALADVPGLAALSQGSLIWFEGPVQLGRVTMPEIDPGMSYFAAGALWFVDKYGRVGAFGRRADVLPAALVALHERRGTTVLENERLVTRPAQSLAARPPRSP
ncbi:MAG: protein kinase [Archangiaceae bacterium]|nr:protein kinase [Archangiaceae bacterium]